MLNAFSAKDLCWQQSLKTKMLNQDLCGLVAGGWGRRRSISTNNLPVKKYKNRESVHPGKFSRSVIFYGGVGAGCVWRDSEQGSSEHQQHI